MADGDQAAVRELLARYRSTVYAAAYAALVDPEQAEAVVAGTFEQAWCNAARFLATHGSVSGWLTHLTRLNVAALAAGWPPT
jgi:DNA-directed RNA polymerase specialized sigma24 family protein